MRAIYIYLYIYTQARWRVGSWTRRSDWISLSLKRQCSRSRICWPSSFHPPPLLTSSSCAYTYIHTSHPLISSLTSTSPSLSVCVCVSLCCVIFNIYCDTCIYRYDIAHASPVTKEQALDIRTVFDTLDLAFCGTVITLITLIILIALVTLIKQ